MAKSIEQSAGGSRRRAGHRGCVEARAFTVMEMLVIIGIIIVLLSIFVPYLMSRVEMNRRIVCANNLLQIRDALSQYANQNHHDFPRVVYDAGPAAMGYTAFTGADDANPFAGTSQVRANDVTASLWLLVRCGLITNPRVFICPSAAASMADRLTGASGEAVTAQQRGNFRRPRNLSYSYASPFSSAAGYRLSDTLPAGFALLADMNPGVVVPDSPSPALLSQGNSNNHGKAGQNVLYVQGEITFFKTPYCGRRVTPDAPADNIYTARAPTTRAVVDLAADTPGVTGPRYCPTSMDDSYLVPTAMDAAAPQGAGTAPSSLPASVPAVTSLPATGPGTAPATTASSPAATRSAQ